MPRDGTKTRNAILDAALCLFVDQGVAETTTRDIAAKAGVAEGSLYRHFDSKEDLAWRLFADNYAVMAARAQAIVDANPKAVDAADALIDDLCRAFDEERYVFRYLLLAQHDHVARVTPDMKSPIKVLRALMRRAIDAGEIGVADADVATALALGPLLQIAAAIIYGTIPPPIRAQRETIRAATLRVLDAR